MSTKFLQRMEEKNLQNKLDEQLGIIRERLPQFQIDFEAIGSALQTIRQEKLYRLKYKTFDECVKTEFDRGKDWAYKLMHKADPKKISYKPGGKSSENGLPETTKVANSAIAEDETKTTETPNTSDGTETNEQQNETGDQEREPGADEQEDAIQDAEGTNVPDIARAAFHAVKEVTEICREIDALKKKIEGKKGFPGWENVLLESVLQGLANARQVLFQSRATHVCPWCAGQGRQKTGNECQCCRGRGWTIKASYNAWAGEQNGVAK